MSHTSPASNLVWASLSCLVEIFLLFHLWSFDRFRCLKWNNGPSSGAFKRVMTYSYLLSVPLLAVYAVGNTAIKYHEGFISHPTLGVIPKPHNLWGPVAERSIFPLMLMFSIGWSLEMVTHLEELCFWLFLINAGSSQRSWFHSLYFKTWVAGSLISVTYMPLVTILTRADPLKAETYTFLAGSLGDLSLTLWFTPILWTFPSFLQNLRAEGVDVGTIVRLTKFSELNTIRVLFRFLFTTSLLVLAIDGMKPHHHVNESMFWTDLLTMLAGFGVTISSGITLVIFFPRSIEGEIAARDASREKRRTRSLGRAASFLGPNGPSITQSRHTNFDTPSGTHLLPSSHVKQGLSPDSYDGHIERTERRRAYELTPKDKYWADEERDITTNLPILPPIRPNRRRGRDIELGGIDYLTENNLSKHNLRTSNVNPMVHDFTSPIDLMGYTSKDYDSQSVVLDSTGSVVTLSPQRSQSWMDPVI